MCSPFVPHTHPMVSAWLGASDIDNSCGVYPPCTRPQLTSAPLSLIGYRRRHPHGEADLCHAIGAGVLSCEPVQPLPMRREKLGGSVLTLLGGSPAMHNSVVPESDCQRICRNPVVYNSTPISTSSTDTRTYMRKVGSL